MIGAAHGPGVLVFLDSHCEVNAIWVQPLLGIIQEDQQSMASPASDAQCGHAYLEFTVPYRTRRIQLADVLQIASHSSF